MAGRHGAGLHPTPESAAILGEMVRARDGIARTAAAEALVHMGTAEAASQVIPLLDAPTMTASRHAALDILETIGEPAVEPLAAVASSPSADLRLGVAEALGWIGSPRAAAVLNRLRNDGDEAVRARASWALGEIGIPVTAARDESIAEAGRSAPQTGRGWRPAGDRSGFYAEELVAGESGAVGLVEQWRVACAGGAGRCRTAGLCPVHKEPVPAAEVIRAMSMGAAMLMRLPWMNALDVASVE